MNPNWQQTSSVRWWMIIQTWLGGVTAVILFYRLQQAFSIQDPVQLFGLILLVGFTPLLFNWQLIRVVTLITTSLHYLSQQYQLTQLPTLIYWPFHRLIETFNQVAEQRQDIAQVRGAFVEQVREAAAQEERQRLARDLHDSIKQQIFGMNISAATAQARFASDPEGALQAISGLQGRATDVMNEMDTLLQQLRPAPLEKMGLIEAIRQQCTSLGYRTGAEVTFTVGELPPDDQLEIGAQEHIYRIVQESLSNIARHARARIVHVSLQANTPDHIQLTISDDGQGFDTAQSASGMGLAHIQDRADKLKARLQIRSRSRQGTTILVSDIPANQSVVSSTLITPEAIEAHLQSQKNRDRRFYTIVTIIAGILPVVWALIQQGTLLVPGQNPIDFINWPVLAGALFFWSLFQMLESRQWLHTANLDANLKQGVVIPLKNYVLGYQLFMMALVGYSVTYGLYWVSRFLPDVWLYERPLSITILLLSLLFAGGVAYFQWQREKIMQYIIQQEPFEIRKTMAEEQDVPALSLCIFITCQLIAWVGWAYFPESGWQILLMLMAYVLFILVGLYLCWMIIRAIAQSVDILKQIQQTWSQRLHDMSVVWNQHISWMKTQGILFFVTAAFWLLNFRLLTTQYAAEPDVMGSLAFWIRTVTAVTLITVWGFTLYRFYIIYQFANQEQPDA